MSIHNNAELEKLADRLAEEALIELGELGALPLDDIDAYVLAFDYEDSHPRLDNIFCAHPHVHSLTADDLSDEETEFYD